MYRSNAELLQPTPGAAAVLPLHHCTSPLRPRRSNRGSSRAHLLHGHRRRVRSGAPLPCLTLCRHLLRSGTSGAPSPCLQGESHYCLSLHFHALAQIVHTCSSTYLQDGKPYGLGDSPSCWTRHAQAPYACAMLACSQLPVGATRQRYELSSAERPCSLPALRRSWLLACVQAASRLCKVCINRTRQGVAASSGSARDLPGNCHVKLRRHCTHCGEICRGGPPAVVPSKGDGELRLRWLDDRTLAAMAADMQLAAVETYTVQQGHPMRLSPVDVGCAARCPLHLCTSIACGIRRRHVCGAWCMNCKRCHPHLFSPPLPPAALPALPSYANGLHTVSKKGSCLAVYPYKLTIRIQQIFPSERTTAHFCVPSMTRLGQPGACGVAVGRGDDGRARAHCSDRGGAGRSRCTLLGRGKREAAADTRLRAGRGP